MKILIMVVIISVIPAFFVFIYLLNGYHRRKKSLSSCADDSAGDGQSPRPPENLSPGQQ
jgi:hypothetical protein